MGLKVAQALGLSRCFSIILNIACSNPRDNQLFYIYKGQRIPLTQRYKKIAVEFKALPKTHSRSVNPLYLQLEKDLQTGTRTRSRSNSQVQVQPLGGSYAVVTLPSQHPTNNYQLPITNPQSPMPHAHYLIFFQFPEGIKLAQ